MEYKNFYENIEECHRRLASTIVLYDGVPHFVIGFADHKPDGIFRVYLVRIDHKGTVRGRMGLPGRDYGIPLANYALGNPEAGKEMDSYMEKYPDAGIIRKHVNSPLFNKFRPFPLGYVNTGGMAIYTERTPLRPKTEQGLIPQMVHETVVSVLQQNTSLPRGVKRTGIYSEEFHDCIVGNYPSIDEVLANLNDPEVTNDGAAFDRDFAVVRGPAGTLFVAHKRDIVGFLPNGDCSKIRLQKSFEYLSELIWEKGFFYDCQIA